MKLRSEVEHKHLQWFVIGAVAEWNTCTGSGLDAGRFQQYAGETVNVVIGYLNGTRRLDGTCSDLQCTIAIEAEKVFKQDLLPASDEMASTVLTSPLPIPGLESVERGADGKFPRLLKTVDGVMYYTGMETGRWVRVAGPLIMEHLQNNGWKTLEEVWEVPVKCEGVDYGRLNYERDTKNRSS